MEDIKVSFFVVVVYLAMHSLVVARGIFDLHCGVQAL